MAEEVTVDQPQSAEMDDTSELSDAEEYVSWDCLKRRGLHIVHLNVRSLLPKIDEVRDIARKTTPAVLCFTETWLDTIQDPEMEIDNYTCVRKDRNRNGGGVATYVRNNNIAFDSRKDLDSELGHLDRYSPTQKLSLS